MNRNRLEEISEAIRQNDHELFDKLVRESIIETAEDILKKEPKRINVFLELENGKRMLLTGVQCSFTELTNLITDNWGEEMEFAGETIRTDEIKRIRTVNDELLQEIQNDIGGNAHEHL